jgi:asparagine synthase (glutamine-hydrolysing)
MCAIIGCYINLNNKKYYNWLERGVDLMTHRGPDDRGTWWSEDNCVGLGHRRLSIIDLSTSGKQPMENFSRNFVIVFNGEIYNYKELRNFLIKKGYYFNSFTDTEVILNAYQEWGTECLTKLTGMFAFTIYDKKKQILFCARDRVGEKPFFYSLQEKNFFFSSELKVFLKSSYFSNKINPLSMDCYLAYGYIPGDLCIADKFKKLPAAHALIFDIKKNSLNIWKYWELSKFQILENTSFDKEDLLIKFQTVLEEVVKKQMVADVPIGVLLSGGVDSSLIATIAAQNTNKLKTFTVGFSQFKEYDERKFARIVANFLGSDHVEIEAGDINLNIIKKLSCQFDEPIADSSMIPTFLVSKEVKKYCTVALGGDGADELFGGYEHYDRLLWLNSYSKYLPKKIKKIIASAAKKYMPIGFKGRNWLQSLMTDFKKELPLIANFFDTNIRSELVKKLNLTINAENIWKERVPSNLDLIQRLTRMDFENYLTEDILVKVDRSSMLNSLEIRSPFLDQRIVEFAFAQVPGYLKTTKSQRKIFLKELAKKILPKELDLNRKQGFSVPLNKWLRSGPWRDFFQSVLSDKNCIFDQAITNKLFANQNKGYNNSERLFNLVLFELWRREYSMNL